MNIAHRFIAFHKGEPLAEWLIEYLINAALRGHITEAGNRVWLIPVATYQRKLREQQKKADEEERRRRRSSNPCKPGPASPSIKKKDCLPLTSFLPRNKAELDRRLLQFPESGPLFAGVPASGTVTPVGYIGVSHNRYGFCLSCGESLAGRRRGTKYCNSACRQAALRSRRTSNG